ncbi:MAG: hypothetical protein AAF152_21610 [Cyanobacteria bacterium P01_A01_bin.114]
MLLSDIAPPATIDRALAILDAFDQLFGTPTSELELRAVIGAILLHTEHIQALPHEMAALIEAVEAAYRSGARVAAGDLANAAAEVAAKRIKDWLQTREEALFGGLAAYAQQFDSTLDSAAELVDVTQTMIAILNDGQLSAPEGRWLLQTALEKFDLTKALQKWVPPEWFAIANQVAQYRKNASFESTVFGVVQAYIQRFQSLLTPELMQHVLKNGTLNVDPQQLLEGDIVRLTEVMLFKMQLLEASPPVTKSAEEIAAQLHTAIREFKARRRIRDLSQPTALGDLEVSGGFSMAPSEQPDFERTIERADGLGEDRQS